MEVTVDIDIDDLDISLEDFLEDFDTSDIVKYLAKNRDYDFIEDMTDKEAYDALARLMCRRASRQSLHDRKYLKQVACQFIDEQFRT